MRRRRLGIASAVVLFLGMAIVVASWRRVEALRFIVRMAMPNSAVGKIARWGTEPVVQDSRFTIPTRYGPMDARLFRSARADAPTILVVPGIHKDGVGEERLATLSRELVAAGFLVVAVAPSALPRYRIDPQSTDQLEDGIVFVAGRPDLSPSGKVAVLGVSFAGGLAVVAAGRPAARASVSSVMSFGGHADLERVLRYLCTGDAGQFPHLSGVANEDAISVPPPNDYGGVAALLSLADHFVPADHVEPLRAMLTTYLQASSVERIDKAAGEALFARSRDMGESLAEPSRGLAALVNDRKVAELGRAIAPVLDRVTLPAGLSPERSPPPTAPVFLLHGAGDSVVPASEMVFLFSAFSGRVPVSAFASRLVSHADLAGARRVSELWGLAGFWAAFLSRAR